MKRTTLAAAGLATDPNPLITAAQGAMSRADDVIFKHPNVASLRPSFPVASSQVTNRRPRAMHIFNGTPVVASDDGSVYYLETVSDVLDSDAMAPDAAISPTQFVEARSNLYYTTAAGVRKVTSAVATGVSAGLKEALGPADEPTTAAGSVLPTGFVWAYRACIVREDANGVTVRSAPSPWWTYENATAGGLVATWNIPLASDVIAGDVVELYRSLAVATGSSPSDILYVSYRHVVTSTNVSNGYASVVDQATEEELGAELYTNSTRDGALKANYPPPSAVALARFSSCVWYGNTTERQTLGFQIRRTQPTGGSTENADGVCFGTRAVTGTSGNTFCTFAAGTGHIHIGMYIYDAAVPDIPGTYFDSETTITNIVGSTLSLSKPLIGSPAGATASISDGITVAGTLFYSVAAADYTEGTREFPVYATGDRAADVGRMARGLAFNITAQTSCYAYATEDTLTAGSVIVRRESIAGASFTVSWTTDANSASDGSIVSLAADLSQTSSALTKPNRVYYSKPDEPEHVPIVNYISVGAEDAPIYALARSRNALLVFKSDGIFKITGSAPDGWRVDEIDSVTRVLRGSCVAEMGGLVYAWTQKGAVAVSELGVQNLSARVISRELDEYATRMAEDPENAGCFVTVWPGAGLVLFGVPDGGTGDATEYVYCYSESTGRWSRWVMATLCAAYDRDSASLYIAKAGAWALRYNSVGATDDGTTGYDTSHTVTTWTADGVTLTITIVNAGDWTPVAGDWVSTYILDSIEYRRVESVSDDGTTYTITISSAFTDADSQLTAYEGIDPVLEWQPHSSPDPFATALWSEMQVAIEAAGTSVAGAGNLLWTVGGSNEHVAAASTVSASTSRSVPALRRTTIRAAIPRAVARGAQFAPYLAGSNLFAPWHCLGVTLVHTPDGGDAARTAR